MHEYSVTITVQQAKKGLVYIWVVRGPGKRKTGNAVLKNGKDTSGWIAAKAAFDWIEREHSRRLYAKAFK